MADAYVYLFMRTHSSGANILSTRRATLEAIKSRGEAVMETQVVVDFTEIDASGFFRGNARQDANADDLLCEQVRSLICRADSRVLEAKGMDEHQSAERYMMGLESRELRKQAITLQALRADFAGLALLSPPPAPSEKMSEHSFASGIPMS